MEKNNTGLSIAKWVGISVTVISLFVIQVVNADVRNRERDAKITEVFNEKHERQQADISTIQADIREIKTVQLYMQKEQTQGFKDIKTMMRDMAS